MQKNITSTNTLIVTNPIMSPLFTAQLITAASYWKRTGFEMIFVNDIKRLAATNPQTAHYERASIFCLCSLKSRRSCCMLLLAYCSNVYGCCCPTPSYSSLLVQYWLVTNTRNSCGLRLNTRWCSILHTPIGFWTWWTIIWGVISFLELSTVHYVLLGDHSLVQFNAILGRWIQLGVVQFTGQLGGS